MLSSYPGAVTIARVARTIADLACAQHIGSDHVAEAIQYRSLERLDRRAA